MSTQETQLNSNASLSALLANLTAEQRKMIPPDTLKALSSMNDEQLKKSANAIKSREKRDSAFTIGSRKVKGAGGKESEVKIGVVVSANNGKVTFYGNYGKFPVTVSETFLRDVIRNQQAIGKWLNAEETQEEMKAGRATAKANYEAKKASGEAKVESPEPEPEEETDETPEGSEEDAGSASEPPEPRVN